MNPITSNTMTCEELLKALNEYVDNDGITALCKDFAEHLAGCNPCQIVVDNIRNTIQLYRDGEPYPLPPEFCDRLRQSLREKWKAKFKSCNPTSS